MQRALSNIRLFGDTKEVEQNDETRLLDAARLPATNAKLFGQPFHAVRPSPLPILMSLVFFFVAAHIILSIRSDGIGPSLTMHWVWSSIFTALLASWIWEVRLEEKGGYHSLEVQRGFRAGIILFILSEVMLFVSFFWAYFHFSLNVGSGIGSQFPPKGIAVFYWWRIPLVNTLILLSSGLSLSLAHGLLKLDDRFIRVRSAFKTLNTWRHDQGPSEVSLYNVTNKNKAILPIFTKGYSRQRIDRWKNLEFNSLLVPSLKTKTQRVFALKRWVEDDTVEQFNCPPTPWAELSETSSRTLGARSVFSAKRAIRPVLTLPRAIKNVEPTFGWLVDTVLRGAVFLGLQGFEFITSLFTIKDTVYSNVFYSLTGLHGLHVFLGALFLAVCAVVLWEENSAIEKGTANFTTRTFQHRVAFDGAAWYWHFVDVVWLFVFVFVYWWGFSSPMF